MVPRLSSSKPCSVEFAALPLCGAVLLAAGFEASGVELRDVAAARELCDDEILEAELAVDEFLRSVAILRCNKPKRRAK